MAMLQIDPARNAGAGEGDVFDEGAPLIAFGAVETGGEFVVQLAHASVLWKGSNA